MAAQFGPRSSDDWRTEFEVRGLDIDEAAEVYQQFQVDPDRFTDARVAHARNGRLNPVALDIAIFAAREQIEDAREEAPADDGLFAEPEGAFVGRGFFTEPTHQHRVARQFPGAVQILEHDEPLLYIPPGGNCAVRCFEKYFGRPLKSTASRSGATTRAIKRCIVEDNGIEWGACPRFVTVDGKADKWRRSSTKHVTTATAVVALLPYEGGDHAVLIRAPDYNVMPPSAVLARIRTGLVKTLSDEQHKVRCAEPRDHSEFCYVYDIETPATRSADGKVQTLYPFGAAYQRVSLNGGEHGAIRHFVGRDCLDRLVTDLAADLAAATGDDGKRVTAALFAHNGGQFDHLFLKTVKSLHFAKQLKGGGRVKSLEVRLPHPTRDLRINCLDSLCFTQLSLKKAAQAFRTPAQKMDFDIANKDETWYRENEAAWVPYLIKDVEVLGQVVAAVQKSLADFGECITKNTGIASVAWRVMSKSCYWMTKQFVPLDPPTDVFIREACYGGRVLHLKKEIENAVCLDANSLYPAAMALGVYPVGRYHVMDAGELVLESYLAGVRKMTLSIAEVELDAGNVRFPLIPHREEERQLTYRAGRFTGVYTSVEVQEALALGYKVLSVTRGIAWAKKGERIFEGLITELYEKRKVLKAAKNPNEHVFKILLNSCYGKMLEKISSHTRFMKRGDTRPAGQIRGKPRELENGQIEVEILQESLSSKPTALGAFILSYSRAIMNRAMVAVSPENVAYSDTDSIYVSEAAIRNPGIVMGPELGAMKNDYGDGTVITRGRFLDLKRYLLRFNQGKRFKAKFVGLAFGAGTLKSWCDETDCKECAGKVELKGDDCKGCGKAVETLFDWLSANPCKTTDRAIVQEKWARLTAGVKISECEMRFTINPDKRAQWDGADYYPLGYDRKSPERKIDSAAYVCSIVAASAVKRHDFEQSAKGLYSSLPLTAAKTVVVPTAMLPAAMVEGYATAAVAIESGEIVGMRRAPGGVRLFHSLTPFGAGKKRPDVLGFTGFVLVVDKALLSGACQLMDDKQCERIKTNVRVAKAAWQNGALAPKPKEPARPTQPLDEWLAEILG